MEKPKISIVVSHPIQHFCPMYALLSQSAEWDIRVFFASSFGSVNTYDPKYRRQVSWKNLQLEKFQHEFLNTKQPAPITMWLDAVDLDTRLNAFNPSVVIVYGYSIKLSRHTIKWASSHHKPLIMISDAELRTRRNVITNVIKKIFIPRLFRQVSAYLTVGDANEEYYHYYGADPYLFFRSPLPINLEAYQTAWETRGILRSEFRASFGIPDNQIVVSMVGKLDSSKRQVDIIKAINHSMFHDHSINLVIVGSGETERELKKIAAKSRQYITFPGFLEPEQLPSVYAATDIYVHSSALDRHPLAISEAIYMGCPVVASNALASIGPTDDIQYGRNALIYPVRNTDRLANCLNRLISNPELMKIFGRESHEIAIKAQKLANGQGLRAALIAMGYL